jgi:hypothetical protein
VGVEWGDRDRDRDRDRERQGETETDRQTDRQIDRQTETNRQTDRQTDRQLQTERERDASESGESVPGTSVCCSLVGTAWLAVGACLQAIIVQVEPGELNANHAATSSLAFNSVRENLYGL